MDKIENFLHNNSDRTFNVCDFPRCIFYLLIAIPESEKSHLPKSLVWVLGWKPGPNPQITLDTD